MTDIIPVLLVFALLIFAILARKLRVYSKLASSLRSELRALREKYAQDEKHWGERASTLEAENQRLAPYRTVADADARAKELLQMAQATLEKANSEAGAVTAEASAKAQAALEKANTEATAVRTEARTNAKALTTKQNHASILRQFRRERSSKRLTSGRRRSPAALTQP